MHRRSQRHACRPHLHTWRRRVFLTIDKCLCKVFHCLFIHHVPAWQFLLVSCSHSPAQLSISYKSTLHESTSVNGKGRLWRIMPPATSKQVLEGSATSLTWHTVLGSMTSRSLNSMAFQAADYLCKIPLLGGTSTGKWLLAAHTQCK